MSQIPFVRMRFYTYLISGLIFLGGPLLLWSRGLNYGLEFTGGTELKVETESPTPESELRARLGQASGVQIFRIDPPTHSTRTHSSYCIRVNVSPAEARKVVDHLIESKGPRVHLLS